MTQPSSSAVLDTPRTADHLRPHWSQIAEAWADGALSREDADDLRAAIQADLALGAAEREELLAWLEPAAPPSASQLAALRAQLHHAHPHAAPARLDVAALRRFMDDDTHELRQQVRRKLAEPAFRIRDGLPTAEYRELVLQWTQALAREGWGGLGYPGEVGGQDDIRKFFAVFEQVAYHDHSLVIKFGVQFGLFGGSIALLGTERHHREYLPRVASLELPGCFAMTELGHGSNVRELETEARYDRATQEFVVHTPTPGAHKEWIGNAACHGQLATVFAQLVIDGTSHGVHAFLVPIRNAQGEVVPGVRIEDDGLKAGLNGVDNGKIWFDHVRIPRANLLNRYADVSPEGEYSSPITNPGRRFFTMLSALVGGRITIALAALSAGKAGLTIAVRYGARRRQFGPPAGGEVPILDYLTHQRRLFPALATAYACDFALRALARRFVARSGDDEREVEVQAAGLKAYTTWAMQRALQDARECCGGQGYLQANRIARLREDTDITCTFEGDNTVLMQLVAKGLLTDFRQQVGGLRGGGLLRFLSQQAAQELVRLNPVVARNTDRSHLRDPAFQGWTFRYREQRLLAGVAKRLKRRIAEGEDTFHAFNDCQDHLLALARASLERLLHKEFRRAVAQAPAAVQPALTTLADLFALSAMERDAAWFLGAGVFEPVKAKAIREEVNTLCREVRPLAEGLVDGFGIPEALLPPIAFSGLPGALVR